MLATETLELHPALAAGARSRGQIALGELSAYDAANSILSAEHAACIREAEMLLWCDEEANLNGILTALRSVPLNWVPNELADEISEACFVIERCLNRH